MMKPIDLYVVPPSPPCRAVTLAARYLGIQVKLIHVDLMKGQQKEDWFVKMNPQHCLPTINDNGFILWESRAIMSYFANKYAPNDQIYPNEPKQRGIVDRFLQYDLNVLYRSFGDYLIPMKQRDTEIGSSGRNDTGADNAVTKKPTTATNNTIMERKVNDALTYLNSVLIRQRYVAGDHLTLADFSIYCSLEFADNFHFDLERFANVHRYFQTLKRQLATLPALPVRPPASPCCSCCTCAICRSATAVNNTHTRSDTPANSDMDNLTLMHQQLFPAATTTTTTTAANHNHPEAFGAFLAGTTGSLLLEQEFLNQTPSGNNNHHHRHHQGSSTGGSYYQS